MNEPINAAVVQNGIVVNIIWIFPEQLLEFNAIAIPELEIDIGWLYENGEFINPNPVIEENTVEG